MRPEKRKVDLNKQIGKIKHSFIIIKIAENTILEIKALDRPKEEVQISVIAYSTSGTSV